tara:strand:- start:37 stop:207 length:171 start_codon:yes stop_codon:yes gene_type:complete
MAFVWWAFAWVFFLLSMYIYYYPENLGLGFILIAGVLVLFGGIFLLKNKMKDNVTS